LTAINKSQYDGYQDINVGISITLEYFATNNITWDYPRNYEPLITYEFSNTTPEYRNTLAITKTNCSRTGLCCCQFLKIENFDADVVKVSFDMFVNGITQVKNSTTIGMKAIFKLF
jgi:hypothetical protein